MLGKLRKLYKEDAHWVFDEINYLINEFKSGPQQRQFTHRDCIFITYADSVQEKNVPTLKTLNKFSDNYLGDFNTLHILPFFPYESDRGFSVLDYTKIKPEFGTWEDVSKLGKNLMFDFVLNHMSDKSEWFKQFLAGENDFFLTFDTKPSEQDLKDVVRPRQSALFVKYGNKYVWRTFLNDQVDLNYKSPRLLVEMVRVMLLYVSKGASYLRLDAVGFLWKELGTTCMHLPETRMIVRILKEILEKAAPHVKLVTETNVPHEENISYFNDGADMVYNFALPVLVLHSLLAGEAIKLGRWAATLKAPPGKTYFNFLDSHDGIGLRPAEGILTREEKHALVDRALKNKGMVSYRTKYGERKPYEMNITWWDFIGGNIDKYIASRAIALCLNGVPGIYIHGLLGTPNDTATYKKTKHNRDLNRKNYSYGELRSLLESNSTTSEVYRRYIQLLKIRNAHVAFNPAAKQRIIENKDIFIVRREYQGEKIICYVNVTAKKQNIEKGNDLVSGKEISGLKPYQVAFIQADGK